MLRMNGSRTFERALFALSLLLILGEPSCSKRPLLPIQRAQLIGKWSFYDGSEQLTLILNSDSSYSIVKNPDSTFLGTVPVFENVMIGQLPRTGTWDVPGPNEFSIYSAASSGRSGSGLDLTDCQIVGSTFYRDGKAMFTRE